jgi:hypothetical protein
LSAARIKKVKRDLYEIHTRDGLLLIIRSTFLFSLLTHDEKKGEEKTSVTKEVNSKTAEKKSRNTNEGISDNKNSELETKSL